MHRPPNHLVSVGPRLYKSISPEELEFQPRKRRPLRRRTRGPMMPRTRKPWTWQSRLTRRSTTRRQASFPPEYTFLFATCNVMYDQFQSFCLENIGVDGTEGDDGGSGVSEAEKEMKVVAPRSEEVESRAPSSSALFPVDIEKLRNRIFNFYPRSGKPFKSVLPDIRYSEVVGRRR